MNYGKPTLSVTYFTEDFFRVLITQPVRVPCAKSSPCTIIATAISVWRGGVRGTARAPSCRPLQTWTGGPRPPRLSLYTLFFRQTLPPFGSQSCQLGLLQNTHSVHKCVCASSSHTLLDSRRTAAKAAAGGEQLQGFSRTPGFRAEPGLPCLLASSPGCPGHAACSSARPLSPFVNDLLPSVRKSVNEDVKKNQVTATPAAST